MSNKQKTIIIMVFADSIFDRHMFSTDNNEYATGLNDENEWDENILDYDISVDQRADDYLDDEDDSRYVYNESGFDRERIN